MAWQEPKFEEPERVEFAQFNQFGDAVQGLFLETEERRNNFGKTEIHIKIKTGEDDDGTAQVKSVRANQRLLAQFANVRPGSLVRVEYTEDRENEGVDREGKPLKPSKIFRVLVDDGKKTGGAAKAAPTEDEIPF